MESINQKEELLKQIRFMKNTSYEELLLIIKSAFSLSIRSAFTFGLNSKEAKENINILKEMFQIISKERKLLNLILENIDYLDLEEAIDTVNMLDDLNDRTYLAYDSIFTEIETACDMKTKDRCLRPRSGIDSLITNKSYEENVRGLIKKL